MIILEFAHQNLFGRGAYPIYGVRWGRIAGVLKCIVVDVGKAEIMSDPTKDIKGVSVAAM